VSLCFATAFYIFERRNRIALSKELLAYVDKVIEQESKLHEHEMVCFLFDCYNQALRKTLQLKVGEGVASKITKRWKSYKNFVDLIPCFVDNNINPFSFFAFTVQAKKGRKIPFLISNVATEKNFKHYIAYLKTNTYKVSTYTNFKEYEDSLYNQLNIDLISLATYLLRKPRISLSSCENFLFSSTTKILLSINKNPIADLDDAEQIFYEDLMFNPEFYNRVKTKWNQLLEVQIAKVKAMHNEHLDKNFALKLKEIVQLLLVLKVV